MFWEIFQLEKETRIYLLYIAQTLGLNPGSLSLTLTNARIIDMCQQACSQIWVLKDIVFPIYIIVFSPEIKNQKWGTLNWEVMVQALTLALHLKKLPKGSTFLLAFETMFTLSGTTTSVT